MRNIKIEQVSKIFNNELVIDNLTLNIPSGKIFALLGPSGCGKTTLLRLIGGFESVNSGKIFLGDEDITDVPINKRKINTVFQNYALFPHLNVFENVAYSLTIKNLDKDTIKEKVFKVLKSVNLESQIYKDIDQLSGGQQQRVALARAIVDEPEVLLLDEPLAALDLKLREKLLIELIELQDKLKTTFIYVTHDQLEALTVADRMAIMSYHGKIEQIGSAKDIYEFPESIFVAKFVGNTNILYGKVKKEDGKDLIAVDGIGTFEVYIKDNNKNNIDYGKFKAISIRPEKILITTKEISGFSNVIKGAVESIIYHGRSTQYNVKIKSGAILQVFEQNEEHFPQEVIDYDTPVYLYFQKENIVLLAK